MNDVLIPYGSDASETAKKLLAAAEDLDLDPGVVRHQPDDGGFRTSEEVADKAGFGEPDEPEADSDPDSEESEESAPKKQAAKKTAKKAAKKTASKS